MGKSKDKHKQKKRKEKKKNSKKRFKEKHRIDPRKGRSTKEGVAVVVSDDESNDFSIPVDLMTNKSHAPETPEEYQQRQSRVRREVDPVTGRSRIIKGDGEVLEEIVSKERHKAINKKVTEADGNFFQENTLRKL